MPQLEKRQAGVEVTPEMIEAGLNVLQGYDEGFDSQAEVVKRIFTVMTEAGSG